jgi:UDP-glucose:(heptosyl)LPS alpha-1,3-glucosyltransferase
MKIAIVIEKADMRGGQNRVIAELSRRLAVRHDVHVFCFEAADLAPEVTVHLLPCPLRHRPIMQEICIPLASRLAVKPEQFDVILAQGGNCPVANSTLVHISQVELAQVKRQAFAQQPDMPAWERTIRNRWQQTALRNEIRVVRKCRGAVMAVSEQLRRTLISDYGLAEDEVSATPNGVDHDRFNLQVRERYRHRLRTELGLDDKSFVVLFMGARWLEKGLDRLLSGVAMLPDRDVHVLVVGDGDPTSVAHLIPEHMTDHVHFTGLQPPEPYFAAADCFVFPTRCEGFGLVMAEAAACGLPLIVTPAGVGAELVEPGVSGYLLPQATDDAQERLIAKQIAAHLASLCGNRDAARQMGLAAREKSLRFTWDRQAELVEQVLTARFAR